MKMFSIAMIIMGVILLTFVTEEDNKINNIDLSSIKFNLAYATPTTGDCISFSKNDFELDNLMSSIADPNKKFSKLIKYTLQNGDPNIKVELGVCQNDLKLLNIENYPSVKITSDYSITFDGAVAIGFELDFEGKKPTKINENQYDNPISISEIQKTIQYYIDWDLDGILNDVDVDPGTKPTGFSNTSPHVYKIRTIWDSINPPESAIGHDFKTDPTKSTADGKILSPKNNNGQVMIGPSKDPSKDGIVINTITKAKIEACGDEINLPEDTTVNIQC